jgi:hypothetical protein
MVEPLICTPDPAFDWIISAHEVAQIILYKNSALKGGLRFNSGEINAESNKRPGQSGTATAGFKESERLPRSSVEAFSLRQRCDDEGAVLGLS